ncbi:hypothetical protein [Psychrobacter celer]|uniref:hypothetical protein n=1 Tax=Psychrobacter celer TaxID=306572 RepID=UPI003FD3CA0A
MQYQGVIDKTEANSLPSLANGVIVGKFKRGRMDKPFKVTASNYKALLGHDPSNPSYLAVEDAFKRGISEVSILRVGQTGGAGGNCMPNEVKVRLAESLNYHITTSLNGGQRKTLTTLDPKYQENPTQFLLDIVLLGTDYNAGSMGFICQNFSSMGDGAPSVDENNQHFMAFSGIASDGKVVFDNTPYDLRDLMLIDLGAVDFDSPTGFSGVEKITPIQSTLAIYPTEGVPRNEDMYYGLDGANDNGDPVFIKSCARAVLSNDATPPASEVLPTYGKRIRTRDIETSRADVLYEYHPENIGNGGENNLNFGNFFADSAYDSQVKGATIRINENGWSDWSNPIDFDEINHANSGGYLGISHTTSKSPNFAINMDGVTNTQMLIGRAITEFGNYGIVFEYGDFDS